MSTNKIYIGIDPGSDGAMAIMWPEIPATATSDATPARITLHPFKDESPYKIADLLKKAKEIAPILVTVEDVHSRPTDGGVQAFAFGHNVGLIHGFLIANCIPYITVSPQNWQSEIWIRNDKVYKPLKAYPKETEEEAADGKKKRKPRPQVDPKPTSINAARRLFPEVSLLRTPKCTKPHDGISDSLLICEYGRRKNL